MDRTLPARATAAVAIAIAHAAGLWLIATHRQAQRAHAPSAGSTSILVFLPEPARTTDTAAPPASTAKKTPASPPSDARPDPRPESSAITIDWALAAESASARAFEEAGERERQLAAFAPKPSPEVDLSPPAKPAPEFGWNRSVTNRIEPLQGGGTFVHINERCGIVFAGFIFPVCSLGKIPARGDLFEHME